MKTKIIIEDTEYVLRNGVFEKIISRTPWQAVKRFFGELRCGWHSGFPLCCIMWYLIPWKLVLRFAKWNNNIVKWNNNMTFYHAWMDRREPLPDIRDLKTDGKFIDGRFLVTNIKPYTHNRWGMIPCPIHLLRRKRRMVKTCFCNQWVPEVKAEALRDHPELCVKE